MSDVKPTAHVEHLEVQDGATGIAIEHSSQTTIQVVAQTVELTYAGVAGRVRCVKIPQIARPQPRMDDFGVTWALQQLQSARARRENLLFNRQDTAAVDAEIRDLTHVTRNGGQLHPGECLKEGRYLLVERIGMGGFATVWRAFDNELRIPVAIKILHSNLSADRWRVARFLRGARVMRALAHPAVVAVLDAPFTDDGWEAFTMEYVKGGNLLQAAREGRLSYEQTLALVMDTASALAEAHKLGFVHRDIKPSNILLDDELKPKLCDFDLVSAADTTGGTRTGALGTFRYTAPELLDRPMDADPRADVYSLGMVLIFALLREDPNINFIGDPDALVASVPCDPIVKGVLRRAVEWRRPEQRFANASEFLFGLIEARAGRGTAWTPPKHQASAIATVETPPATLGRVLPPEFPPDVAGEKKRRVIVQSCISDCSLASSIEQYLEAVLGGESLECRVECAGDSLFDAYGRDLIVTQLRRAGVVIGIVTERAVRSGALMALLGAAAALGATIIAVYVAARDNGAPPACLAGLEGISCEAPEAWRMLAGCVARETGLELLPPSQESDAALDAIEHEIRGLKLFE